MNGIVIRNERKSDFREVEILTRKAFWNVNVPSCRKYHVCMADGSYPAAMLVKELAEGTISSGKKWFYHESPAYAIECADAEKFDAQFEPMKKEFCPSQEEFYIHSHSIIQDPSKTGKMG